MFVLFRCQRSRGKSVSLFNITRIVATTAIQIHGVADIGIKKRRKQNIRSFDPVTQFPLVRGLFFTYLCGDNNTTPPLF